MASLRPALRTAALVLHVDTVTAEVVTSMRDAGIRSLILKGPSIAAWLYSDGTARPYGDSDLLVAPQSYRGAGDVLRQLGFRPIKYSWHRDSQTWLRGSDSAEVDLHRSLVGVQASPDVVWKELTPNADTLQVGGIDLEVLSVPGRAFHVALHAAQHGAETQPPLEDLARAIRTGDEAMWRQATELARRLDALPAFAAGLRLDAEGVLLAERLTLPAGRPPSVALRAGYDVPVAVALESIVRERSLRARVLLLLRAFIPSRLYMRHWSAMHLANWPAPVRQGPLGLGLAYLWRPIWIVVRLRSAISALRRARRNQAQDEG